MFVFGLRNWIGASRQWKVEIEIIRDGGTQEHRTFMSALETITIYADFGMSPYAWRKYSSDRSSYVGGNIADSTYGLSKVIGTSPELDAAFAEWIARFDCKGYETTLDWDRFHYDGIELAKHLKAEVGDRYEVEYHPPHEDPERGGRAGLIARIVSPEKLFMYYPMMKGGSVDSPCDASVSTFSMRLFDCSVGWIYMSLSCNDVQVTIHMTHLDDPLECFLRWMEELIAGQEICTMKINEEGNWKILTATQKTDGLLIFRIEDSDSEESEPLLEKIQCRQQLIGTIYQGLRAFGESPEYFPEEWEYQSLGGWVSERTNLSEEEVLDALVSLPAGELNSLLFLISCLPVGGHLHVRLESIKSFFELKDYALRSDCPDLDELRAKFGKEWTGITDKTEDKRGVIRDEFLSEPFIPWRGTPLRGLKSEKTEAYLTSNLP